jgi:hypothetical protein
MRKGAVKMNKMELRERLDELRKVINGANKLVFIGDMLQAAAWTTKSMQLIRGILQDLEREDE